MDFSSFKDQSKDLTGVRDRLKTCWEWVLEGAHSSEMLASEILREKRWSFVTTRTRGVSG